MGEGQKSARQWLCIVDLSVYDLHFWSVVKCNDIAYATQTGKFPILKNVIEHVLKKSGWIFSFVKWQTARHIPLIYMGRLKTEKNITEGQIIYSIVLIERWYTQPWSPVIVLHAKYVIHVSVYYTWHISANRDVEPMLALCWISVADAGPT